MAARISVGLTRSLRVGSVQDSRGAAGPRPDGETLAPRVPRRDCPSSHGWLISANRISASRGGNALRLPRTIRTCGMRGLGTAASFLSVGAGNPAAAFRQRAVCAWSAPRRCFPRFPRSEFARRGGNNGRNPRLQILAIVFAHRWIVDQVCDLGDAPVESRAALRRIEAAGFRLAQPQHLGERPRAADTSLDGVAPPERTRSSGSCPSGSTRIARLARLEARQRHVDRSVSGTPAGIVAVEAQHRLVGHFPDQRELLLGERRAERRNRAPRSPRSPSRSRRHSLRPTTIGAPWCAAWRAAAML